MSQRYCTCGGSYTVWGWGGGEQLVSVKRGTPMQKCSMCNGTYTMHKGSLKARSLHREARLHPKLAPPATHSLSWTHTWSCVTNHSINAIIATWSTRPCQTFGSSYTRWSQATLTQWTKQKKYAPTLQPCIVKLPECLSA